MKKERKRGEGGRREEKREEEGGRKRKGWRKSREREESKHIKGSLPPKRQAAMKKVGQLVAGVETVTFS